MQTRLLLQPALQSACKTTSLTCTPDGVLPLLRRAHGTAHCLLKEGHTSQHTSQHSTQGPNWSFLGPPTKFMSCCVALGTAPSGHPPQRTASFFALLTHHILLPSAPSRCHHSFSGPYSPQAEEPGVRQKMEQKVWERPDPCFSSRFCRVKPLHHCLVSSTIHS